MRNTNKKGFTIVELVIVVAVIAILAAVLIPTFSGIIRKANVSKDNQLIAHLNTALAADVDGDKTMAGAIAAAEEFGYDIGKINAKANGNEILWDSVANVFCYLNDGVVEYVSEVANKGIGAQLWIISDEIDPVYSTYLVNRTDATVNAVHSLDVTACGAVDVIVPANAGTVSIFTNGGSLTVNGGAVTHYGAGYILTVAESAKANYVEKGYFAANANEITNAGDNADGYTYVASASELAQAFADGKDKIALSADINIESNPVEVAYNFTITSKTELNLNGHNIQVTQNLPTNGVPTNFGVIKIDKCEVVICGAGKITAQATGNNMGWNAGSKVLELQGNANVTIEEGVLINHLGGTDMAYGIDMLNSNGSATLNIEGGLVRSNNYIGIRIFNNNKVSTVNVNKGVVEGASRDIWAQNPSQTSVDANAVVNIASTYKFTMKMQANYDGTELPKGRNYYID